MDFLNYFGPLQFELLHAFIHLYMNVLPGPNQFTFSRIKASAAVKVLKKQSVTQSARRITLGGGKKIKS